MKPMSARTTMFLKEMGLAPLWLRRTAIEVSADELPELESVPVVPAPANPSPAAAEIISACTAWFDQAPLAPAVPPVSNEAIAGMNWAELEAAAASCTRCGLCQSRKRPVFGRGDQQADWLVIGSSPSLSDEKEARPVSGAAGALLDNMLKAIELAPPQNVYVSNLVKCRAQDASGLDRAPGMQELAACRPYLEREMVLTQAQIALVLGQTAAQGLMAQEGATTRGQVHQFAGMALVVTEHPAALLLRGEDKAQVWVDLCLAKDGLAKDGLAKDGLAKDRLPQAGADASDDAGAA